MKLPLLINPAFGVVVSVDFYEANGDHCMAVSVDGPRGGQTVLFYESDADDTDKPSKGRKSEVIITPPPEGPKTQDQDVAEKLARLRGEVLKG